MKLAAGFEDALASTLYPEAQMEDSRGRGACLRLGNSSSEATSFHRTAVVHNCRIAPDLPEDQAIDRRQFLVGASLTTFEAMLGYL